MARQINLKGSPKNVKAIAAVAGGILLVAVFGYLMLYSPEKSKATKLDGQIAAAQSQLAAAEAAANTPPPKDPRVDDLFRLTKAMPTTPDMPGILIEMSDVAKATGITFTSIQPGALVAGNGFQTVPIQLIFSGNYYELSDFLFRLNNLVADRDGKLQVGGRLYSVDSVDFSSSGGTTLDAKVSARAYIYGTGATADGGSAGATSTTPPVATPPATTTPPAGTATSTAAAPAAGSSS